MAVDGGAGAGGGGASAGGGGGGSAGGCWADAAAETSMSATARHDQSLLGRNLDFICESSFSAKEVAA